MIADPCSVPAAGQTSSGEPETISRTELQRFPAPIPGWLIVQPLFHIPVGLESGAHSHPVPEIGYIIEGDVEIVFADGRPTQRVRGGEPFHIPPGVVHNARNVGTSRTKMLSSYVIDATKPLVTPH